MALHGAGNDDAEPDACFLLGIGAYVRVERVLFVFPADGNAHRREETAEQESPAHAASGASRRRSMARATLARPTAAKGGGFAPNMVDLVPPRASRTGLHGGTSVSVSEAEKKGLIEVLQKSKVQACKRLQAGFR